MLLVLPSEKFLEELEQVSTTHTKNCSRGIRYAWQFYYALVLVIKLVCGGIGIALLTLNKALAI
ncbi:DUF3265 domain-containing protein [Vibrio alginolyticus]|nr:DUF3265 domain-containing protein [Vibrio alginolyticus]MBT0024035.1 DUF3265 domain-containing protein [Vibrio alginolyticus]